MTWPGPFKQPNPFEARILQVLSFALRPLTTRQIAQMSGISYNTVVKHLGVLRGQRKIRSQRMGNKIVWFF